MTWEIVVGLLSLVGSLIAVMNVVVRVNKSLTTLEAAVQRLDEIVREQAGKNEQFSARIGEHETRIVLLENSGDRGAPRHDKRAASRVTEDAV